MNANETSNILYTILVVSCTVFAGVNLWNFKEFKALKTENELLKIKLKDCEQRRTQSIHG